MSDHVDRRQAILDSRTLKAQAREAKATVARKCLAEGLSYADIARRIGMSDSGVQSLLNKRTRR